MSAADKTGQRLLAVDFGAERIGLAISDGALAVPLTIVAHERRDRDLERVAQVARERACDAVIVGLPLLGSGEEGGQARRTRRFGDALARRLDVPVLYHDERFSSVAAEALAEDVGDVGARRKGSRRIDDAAAAVILQSYLDARAASAGATAPAGGR